MKTTKNPKLFINKILTLALFIYIIITSSLIYFTNYNKHFFQYDEHEFLRKSIYYDLLFVKHDTQNPQWHDYKYGDIAQPKVGPYIYGLALHLKGIGDIDHALTQIGYNKTDRDNGTWKDTWWYRWLLLRTINIPVELQPSFDLIFFARKVAISFTVATIGLVFIWCRKVTDSIFAFIATCLTMMTPSLLFEGKSAMTDGMQLFFFYLNLVLFMVYLKKPKYLLAGLLGITTALGAGVKVTGAMSIIFISLMYIVIFIFKKIKRQSGKIIILSFTVTTFLYLLTFYLLHPYLHQQTLLNFRHMYLGRMETARGYYWQEFPNSAVRNRKQALLIIIRRTLLPGESYVNFNYGNIPTDLILYLFGILLLVKRTYKEIFKKFELSPEAIFLFWNLLIFIALVFYLNNDWPRYYLPMMVSVCLVEAYAVTSIIKACFVKIRPLINF